MHISVSISKPSITRPLAPAGQCLLQRDAKEIIFFIASDLCGRGGPSQALL